MVRGTLDATTSCLRQVALADHILITKLDLVDAERRGRRPETALTRSCAASIRRPRSAAIDDPALDAVGAARRRRPPTRRQRCRRPRPWLNLGLRAHDQARPSKTTTTTITSTTVTRHDDIESFAFIREEPTSRYALQLLLNALEQNLGPNLLRVKGLVNVAEEPDRPAVIQGAQHLLHNISWLARWPDADRRTRIVFITQNIARAAVEEMISLLDRVATRTAKARERAANLIAGLRGGGIDESSGSSALVAWEGRWWIASWGRSGDRL